MPQVNKNFKDFCFAYTSLTFIVFPFVIFTVWGTFENRHVINFIKLENYLLGRNCTTCNDYIIKVFDYNRTSQYKNCKDLTLVPYDMWYCYQILSSSNNTLAVDQCLNLANVTDQISIHHTVFSNEFKNNPFEIALTIVSVIYFVMCICACNMAYCQNSKNGYTTI